MFKALLVLLKAMSCQTSEACAERDRQRVACKRKVLLDGNNMLYVKDQIRAAARHSSGKASRLLACYLQERLIFPKTVLVFDSGRPLPELENPAFNVRIARPAYREADDMIVDLAAKDGDKTGLLVVTSDRELRRRVEAVGVETMKSGHFMKLVANR